MKNKHKSKDKPNDKVTPPNKIKLAEEMPIIMVNEAGAKHIQALCDVALKAGGLANLRHINLVLGSIRPVPKQPEEPKQPAEDQKC